MWLREEYSIFFGLLGGLVLIFCGVVPNLQLAHFHRIYEADGRLFIVSSVLLGIHGLIRRNLIAERLSGQELLSSGRLLLCMHHGNI